MTVKYLRCGELSDAPTLADFIHCELSCEGMCDDLKRLIKLGHMISFEYECNQYNVMYDGINSVVTIRDAIHEKHSSPEYYKRISISAADFLDILSTKCGEL